jgi:hypothetical protein
LSKDRPSVHVVRQPFLGGDKLLGKRRQSNGLAFWLKRARTSEEKRRVIVTLGLHLYSVCLGVANVSASHGNPVTLIHNIEYFNFKMKLQITTIIEDRDKSFQWKIFYYLIHNIMITVGCLILKYMKLIIDEIFFNSFNNILIYTYILCIRHTHAYAYTFKSNTVKFFETITNHIFVYYFDKFTNVFSAWFRYSEVLGQNKNVMFYAVKLFIYFLMLYFAYFYFIRRKLYSKRKTVHKNPDP